MGGPGHKAVQSQEGKPLICGAFMHHFSWLQFLVSHDYCEHGYSGDLSRGAARFRAAGSS